MSVAGSAVRLLSSLGEHSFWPVWLAFTAVAAISTAWAVSSNAPRPGSSRRLRGTPLPLAFLALFLAGYIAVTLIGEDFTFYDNSTLTLYSLRGIDFPPPIWRESGRFFPLGLQEFNWAGRVTRSVAGYHAIPILQLLVLVAILLVLENRLSLAARAALIAFALLLPSVLLSFTALVYPEVDVVFWIACVAVSVELFARTRSVCWAIGGILSAQIALYYKEPVFLFLLTFSVMRIVLRARNSGSIREALSDTETRLDLAIAGVSLAFVGFYAIVILASSNLRYLADTRISTLQTVRAYLRSDWIVWVFSVFTVVRIYRVFRRAATPVLLWDGLACGALVYFAAHLALGMVKVYYLAPADLIAALYLGRFLCLSWNSMRPAARTLAAGLALLVILQSLDLSILRMVERKYTLQRKVSVANVILAAQPRDPGRATRLYFPFTSRYGIAEFAAYLSYRGVHVEGAGDASPRSARIELYSPKTSQTERCVPIRDFLCHAGPRGDEDLTVVLRDDSLSPSEYKLYFEFEEKLLAREPVSPARARFFRTLEWLWKRASLN